MILYIKSLNNPKSIINVEFNTIAPNGKIDINFSNISQTTLCEIDKLALAPKWTSQVNLEKLTKEIAECRPGWIKSHYYGTDQFNSITTDLIVDPISLPFVVTSNLVKTNTLEINLNKIIGLITDPKIKIKYALYSVANFFISQQSLNQNRILVSDLLVDLNTFKAAVNRTELELEFSVSNVYNQWLASNQQYLPSSQYKKMIAANNYDFMNAKLSLAERYSLMALAGSKFINLESNENMQSGN
jgi:hypothetical protein